MDLMTTDTPPDLTALDDPTPQRPALHGAMHLPVHLVRPNPWNRQVADARLAEMVDSVRKLGVLQPVLVRPAASATPASYITPAAAARGLEQLGTPGASEGDPEDDDHADADD